MKGKRIITGLLALIIALSLSTTALASSGTVNESEPNNSMSTADRTYDDRDNYGTIGSDSDEDWWVISFTKAGCGSFWLGNIPSGTDFDMQIYNSSGGLITKSTKSSNIDEFATVDVKANTNYYVRIYGNGKSSTSKYLLRIKLYSWKDAYCQMYEQGDSATCGAANMRMVLTRYGIYVSEGAITQRAAYDYYVGSYKNQELHCEILNSFLKENSNSTRFKYTFVNDISAASYWSNIQSNINNGHPIIALCEYDNSPYFGTSGGHFITIRSYSPDAQIKQIRVNDSTKGSYGVKGIPFSNFHEYTLYPNGRCHFTSVLWS